MIGYNALPENYRKEIEAIAEEKFSFPNYSFNSLVESTLERAKKVFVEAGERKPLVRGLCGKHQQADQLPTRGIRILT